MLGAPPTQSFLDARPVRFATRAACKQELVSSAVSTQHKLVTRKVSQHLAELSPAMNKATNSLQGKSVNL